MSMIRVKQFPKKKKKIEKNMLDQNSFIFLRTRNLG